MWFKKNSFEFVFFIYIFLFKDIPLHFHRRDLWYFLVCCFHKPWSKSMKLMLAVWPATKNVPPIICLPISYRFTKKLSKKICISKCFNQFNRLWKVYYKLHEIISTIPICIKISHTCLFKMSEHGTWFRMCMRERENVWDSGSLCKNIRKKKVCERVRC